MNISDLPPEWQQLPTGGPALDLFSIGIQQILPIIFLVIIIILSFFLPNPPERRHP